MRRANSRQLLTAGAAALSVAMLTGGCAATPSPPTDHLTGAEQALQRAEERGAQQHAPLELRLAQEKLQAARAAYDREQYEASQRHAQEARVSAELAETRAEQARAERVAQTMRESVQTLRREIERSRQREPQE